MMIKRLITLMLLLLLNACGLGGLPAALEQSIMDQTDPETASRAVPAYLVMLDTLVAKDPEDAAMNAAAAKLYAFYATSLSTDKTSNARLAERARTYGARALCLKQESACNLAEQPFKTFRSTLDEIDDDALPELYAFSVSWLAWLQTHSGDMRALAELPRVEETLQHILDLDEGWERGSAHLYLGILKAMRPPALGGKPEESRAHFERALLLSEGRDLSFKVAYARYYSRTTFNRELHDRLLSEVINSPREGDGRTLINTLAQQEARQLLESAESYF